MSRTPTVRPHRSSAGDVLTGLSRSALLLAVMAGTGVALAVLLGRHRGEAPTALHRSAAAAAAGHTIPTQPPVRR